MRSRVVRFHLGNHRCQVARPIEQFLRRFLYAHTSRFIRRFILAARYQELGDRCPNFGLTLYVAHHSPALAVYASGELCFEDASTLASTQELPVTIEDDVLGGLTEIAAERDLTLPGQHDVFSS